MKCAPGFEKGLMLDVELTLDFKKHWQVLEGLVVKLGTSHINRTRRRVREEQGRPLGSPEAGRLTGAPGI